MCHRELDADCFRKNARRKDGLQSQCIECHRQYRREHYEKNRRKYIDKAGAWKKSFVEWWKEYKSQFSCAQCGESHPACIHFHHDGDDKEDNVSSLVVAGCKERVLEEISKCIPLCANCHAKLHWRS